MEPVRLFIGDDGIEIGVDVAAAGREDLRFLAEALLRAEFA
ncbi:hypothetical protein [Kitasatospora arboriphila]|uniref:Uncharacterized protein n=1 Tax=Kitasatospora arboriphila TaxID=258052 RepID=A0ABP4E2H8_9ACTN